MTAAVYQGPELRDADPELDSLRNINTTVEYERALGLPGTPAGIDRPVVSWYIVSRAVRRSLWGGLRSTRMQVG